jgi:Fur family transcriptional regulator, peroxide stress response regulator
MFDSDDFRKILKKAGFKLTPQRLAVCQALFEAEDHPSARMLYERLRDDFPSLSLATVYNTLETLVNLGLVNVLGGAFDGVIHYDGDTSPHINLACISCHRVIDHPSQYIDRLEEEVSKHSGYKILGARVLYYGLCTECQ